MQLTQISATDANRSKTFSAETASVSRQVKRAGLMLAATLSVLAGCQGYQNLNPANDSRLLKNTSQHISNETASTTPILARTISIDLTDDYMQSVFLKSRELVEAYFDISLTTVAMEVVKNDVIETEVRRETNALITPQFSDAAYAQRFLSKIMEDQAGTYAALYANQGKRILVNRTLLTEFLQSIGDQQALNDPNLIEQALKALLIHEAVHAADDQIHQIHERREMNFRASFSQSAAYEGHAQLVTREICEQEGCSLGLRKLDDFMFNAPEPTDPLARSMQAISRNVLEYSYIEGERFLAQLKERSNGQELLTSVLRSPPADPVQILDPTNYPDQSRVSRNQYIFNTIGKVTHDWNQSPWALIETSPIKGLNLRNDPMRREATIEGFTKLIVSMVGAQAYDQSGDSMAPIEITVIQTDHSDTASLFAKSFHEKALNSQPEGGKGNRFDLTINQLTEKPLPMVVYLSNVMLESPTGNYSTLIAHSGEWIVQAAGVIDANSADMIDFAEKVVSELRGGVVGL